jgi:hypothetical protein
MAFPDEMLADREADFPDTDETDGLHAQAPLFQVSLGGSEAQEIFTVWSEKLTVTESVPSITVQGTILKVRMP